MSAPMIGSSSSRLETGRPTSPKRVSRFSKPVVAVLSLALFFSLAIFLLRSSQAANSSHTFLVFGPVDYVRERGKPKPVTNNFSVVRPEGDYLLRIYNGGRNNQYRTTSKAAVWLNGIKIVRPRDFNHNCNDRDDDDDRDDERDDNDTRHNVRVIEKRVTLVASNTLRVKLRGARASGMTLEIVGIDPDAPTITAAIAPAPNAAGWNNTNPTVSFTCADLTSGIATCPTPVTLTSEGANQVVTGTAEDGAGNSASVSVALNLDKKDPAITIASPANGATFSSGALTVTGTINDALSGIAAVTCNGVAATLSSSAFTCDLHLNDGLNPIEVRAGDNAGNQATANISVTFESTPMASVPNVVAASHPAADSAIRAASLSVGAITTANSDSVPTGRVITQNPAAGSAVAMNSQVDLVLSLGGAGVTPPISFSVDANVTPAMTQVAPLADGAARPVAAVTDARGHQAEFVENELMLTTADANLVSAFVARWNGQILLTINPPSKLSGLSPMYLVRIDTSRANAAGLLADLRAVNAKGQGDHRVSSESGLRLLAAMAMETVGGMNVYPNYVLRPDQFLDGRTIEDTSTPSPFAAPTGTLYPNDAFTWPYMNTHSLQNISVDRAWRALEATGRSSNRVDIMIADGGFWPNADFPANTGLFGMVGEPGPGTCGGSPCPWHGSDVAMAAMGLADNSFGAAGPGSPVANAIILGSPSFDIGSILGYVFDVFASLAEGPDIINISASARIPAALCLTGFCTLLDGVALTLRTAGTMVVASAGNESANVDSEDCFIDCDAVSWEDAVYIPCELEGVVCVGGLDWNSRNRHPNSNFGSDPEEGATVDIYGPFQVWVGPDPATPRVHLVGGTSFSAPFIAGVAALVMAANPDLSVPGVENILFSTAHTNNPDSTVPRRIDAYEAVKAALPNAPPEVTVGVDPGESCPGRPDEICASRGVNLTFGASVLDREDGRNVSLTWASDIDGDLGIGRSFVKNDLSFGTHRITATATDTEGVHGYATIIVNILNDQAPVVTINQPIDRAVFTQASDISLAGSSHDQNNPPGFSLSDAEVSWQLDGSLTEFASGHNATIAAGILGPGVHTLRFRGFDGSHSGTDLISIWIQRFGPPIGQPPSVSITSPPDGAVFMPVDVGNQTFAFDVTFTSEASDPEDGTPLERSFVWSDSINGGSQATIGVGRTLFMRLFTEGLTPVTEHAITLEVTDRDGNVGSATIHVRLIFPDGDADGLSYDQELAHGTNPASVDTDSDGVWDGAEVFLATDPSSNASVPRDIPAGTLLGSSSDVRSGAALTLVNPSNGSFGVLGRPNGGLGFGLAFDINGALYLALGSQLVTVNPLNGATTQVGALQTLQGESIDTVQLAFNPSDGMLYGVEEGPAPNFPATGQLLRINPATAGVTRVGSGAGDPAIHALAFTRIGTLFASIDSDASTDRLVEISSTTGVITREISSAGPTTFGLAIDRSGTLLASHRISNELSDLLTLNPASGAATTLTSVARALFGLTIKSCGTPCFELTPGSPISVLTGDDLAAGDLNGDQSPDVVTSSGSVLIGNGDGTFQVGTPWGSPAFSITLSDLNGDARLDLVAADADNNSVLVLMGNGNGSFQGAQTFAAGSFPVQVEAGDFNGDQIPDLVVANSGSGGGVSVLKGSGNGTFQPPISASTGWISAIAVADLNGDTNLDVAAVGAPTESQGTRGTFTPVQVLLGNGQGNLSLSQAFIFGGPAGGPETRQGTIALADMTSDQVPDIITANFQGFSPFLAGSTGSVAVLPNMVYGFNPSTAGFFVAETPFVGVTIADVNGDGNLDAVATSPVAISPIDFPSPPILGHLAVFLGNGNGTLQAPRRFVVGPDEDARAVVLADLDRDGDLDAVTANGFGAPGGVSVLLNNDSFGAYPPF